MYNTEVLYIIKTDYDYVAIQKNFSCAYLFTLPN